MTQTNIRKVVANCHIISSVS